MNLRFVFAGAAAAAILTAQPVMASGTLSSGSLPAAGVSVQPAASLGDTSRVGAIRSGSRVGAAEGNIESFFTVLLSNPLYVVGAISFVGLTFDAFNIIDLGIINSRHINIGPYGTVA